jgi:glutathione S-transferase
VRRLIAWFDGKMAGEVTLPLLFEKVIKRNIPDMSNQGPNSAAIRQAKNHLKDHLSYITHLADRRNWLSGDTFSQADICAAVHMSVIDYFGDVPWEQFEGARSWYARIKSRPSFRSLLADRVPGIKPCDHYKNLDF